jgi:hypothetical protein
MDFSGTFLSCSVTRSKSILPPLLRLFNMKILARRCAVYALAAATILAAMPAMARYDNPDPDPATGLSYMCEWKMGLEGCAQFDTLAPQRVKSAPKPGVWGSIAVAPNLDWGDGWNYKTRKEAEAGALARCKSHSGATNCKIAVDAPGYCVAMAMSSSSGIAAVSEVSGVLDVVEQQAKERCTAAGGKNCTIAASLCADNVHHVLPPSYMVAPAKKP